MHADKMEEWNRKVRTLYTWSHLYLGFKVAQVHSRLLPEQKRAAFWKTRHSKFAQAMWSSIADLRGWWVKVGQFLSTRGDLLPDEYVSELSKVQDMMPTSQFPVIKEIIENQLGLSVDDIFEWIEEKALASASIGQVHKAKLKPGARDVLRRCHPNPDPDNPNVNETVEFADEGQDNWGNDLVVLKIQHPNVDRMLLQDMELLKQLSWAFGLLEKGMNINEILEEWGKESRMELDFRYEAYNQKFIQRCIVERRLFLREHNRAPPPTPRAPHLDLSLADHLACEKIEDEVKVPLVLYASRKMMIMEYVNGFKCTDMSMIEKYHVDVNDLCRRVVRSFAEQIHIFGLFNADPHPGNIIIQLDPSTFQPVPVLLDWGLIKKFTQEQRLSFCRLIVSISQIDLMGLMKAFQEMGFKFKKRDGTLANSSESDPIPVDPEIYMDAIQVLFKNSGNGAAGGAEGAKPGISQKDKDEAWARAKETKIGDVQAVNPLDDWPKDIIFFLRVASLLHGLTVQLKAQVPFFQIMLETAEEAIRQHAGLLQPELSYVYKPHGAAALAAYYNCPFQQIVFGTEGTPPVPAPAAAAAAPTNLCETTTTDAPLPNNMPPVDRSSSTANCAFSIRSLLEWKIFKILATLQGEGVLVGAQVCIWHRKNQRADICIGRMGVYDSRPVSQRSLFTAFSLTNVLMITMILYLVSKNKIKLTDCISEWWDGFVRGDKRMITINDLLCHQTGIHSWLPSTLTLNQICNYNYMVKVAENATPVCAQGQCGHYPHVCGSYLYHHLLVSILKQMPGKYLRTVCLKEWKLKHLLKLIYFPLETATSGAPAMSKDPDDTRRPQRKPHVRLSAAHSPEDGALIMDTPLIIDSPASRPGAAEVTKVHVIDSGHHVVGPDTAEADACHIDQRFGDDPAQIPLICHFTLDEASLFTELDSIRKLEPAQISSLLCVNAPPSRSLGSTDQIQKLSTDGTNLGVSLSHQMSSLRLPPTHAASYVRRLSGSGALNASGFISPSGTGNPYAATGNDTMARLVTVSRDLGVAKMADAANMNNQTIGATDEDLNAEPAERERNQQRKEWLQKLQEYKDLPVMKRDEKPTTGGGSHAVKPVTFLSKFPGRIGLIEEYLKQRELATSKIVALQALLSQKAEGLSAFQLMRKRPHLLDPMFFNAEPVIPLHIPFANARVSARALATLLHYVTRGAVMKDRVLANALKPRALDLSLEARVATGGWLPLYGLGYQLIPLRESAAQYSAKETLVRNDNFELRHGARPKSMPKRCGGVRELFKETLVEKRRRRLPIFTTGNVHTEISYRKATRQSPTPVSAPSVDSSLTESEERRNSSEEEESSVVESAVVEDKNAMQPTTYAYGGSDTGGNLCFSIPSEQLSICVLVNDHVSGAHISRIVLQEVLASFGLQALNNLSSVPASASFL